MVLAKIAALFRRLANPEDILRHDLQPADRLRIFGMAVRDTRIARFSDKGGVHAGRGKGREKNHLYTDDAVKTFFVLETEGLAP